MTQPDANLPVLTPPVASPEEARAMMNATAQMLTAETGVVVTVNGDRFMLGNMPMTIDQVISTLCKG
jgi:sensor domain CHASE-containing protein